MRLTQEEIAQSRADQAAARALADGFGGRIADSSLAAIVRLIDAGEAPIGLNHLAHAIDRLAAGSVTESERQRLFNLVHGTGEDAYLPRSFDGMNPRPEAWWLERADPAT